MDHCPSGSSRKHRDLILDLPNVVMEKILLRLPLKEAARTSILSTKWRYIWTRLPQLIFDHQFDRSSILSSTDKLTLPIFIMFLHQAPILKFTLCIPGLESCHEIDRIIQFLSRNKVEDFTLVVSEGRKHRLPSHFFSCRHLKHLYLYNCEFRPPPSFRGFSKLTSLVLYDVRDVSNKIGSFISSFPLLEQLTFLSSTSCKCLDIDSPNLQRLRIGGVFNSLSLKNVPRLLDLSITSFPHPVEKISLETLVYWNSLNIEDFFNCLQSLEKLELDYVSLKCLAAGSVLERPLCTLSSLKDFSLWGMCFTEKDEISLALWLIRSSPNLRRITIEFDNAFVSESLLDSLDVQDFFSSASLRHVHQACLRGLTGAKPELEFIRFLLAEAPRLNKLSVQPLWPVTVRKENELLKKIIEFQRASPAVKFKYLDPLAKKV